MKKNITKEQWDELDEKKQRKFLKFLGYSDVSIDNKYDCDKYIPKDAKVEAGIRAGIEYIKYGHLSNVDIGAMIEFLNLKSDSNKNLCNALWERVKHKLLDK